MSQDQENPEFLKMWLRVPLLFLVLCVAFAPMQVWVALFRSDE